MSHRASPGKTQHFVIAKGFEIRYGRRMLIDADGYARLFFELSADPDHSHYSPEAAYQQLLLGMQPGSTLRLLNVHWPNPSPRTAFLRQMKEWQTACDDIGPGLHQSLEVFLTRAPLPFFQQILMELVIGSEEQLDWADSLPEWLWSYGIRMRLLTAIEVQDLANHVFNTRLE